MMKNRIMAGFAALALSVAGFAAVQDATNQQTPADHAAKHQQMKQRHMDNMAQELNLNDSQKQQFDALMKSTHEKMKSLQEQHEQQMKQIHESALNDASKFLTPDQMTKLKAMHERMGPGGHMGMKHKRHHGPDGDNDGPPPPPKQ